ncbi:unnamed protein product [Cylicostephanus goldi]|uniref:Uncharacterized protein n=1 Tax=Cylicostephanus goldi TaxID=71465 RepID=A0A3P7PP52_CYLGO|nr:unnamed protein product [Cylicostephanus goldi]
MTPSQDIKDSFEESLKLNSQEKTNTHIQLDFTSSENNQKTESGATTVPPAFFPGFVTAGSNKVITVTAAALEAAQRRLNEISESEVQLFVYSLSPT